MVQPGPPSIRLLENLPQRPPTPPRESKHSNIQTEASVLQKVLSSTVRAHTPPDHSPKSSTESSKPTSDKSRKKVEWSAWTEYKEPPHKDSAPEHNIRPLPPSGDLKPAKSILKPYSGDNLIDRRIGIGKLAAPHTYPNFATMLESIVKQLAGEDRSSRIDAYLTLSGVLKASDNVPDPKALKEKMGLLTQFIQRDMSAKTASGTLDTVIINNALILLAFFVWNPPAAECLSNDFCSFFVEHAITAIKDPLVSKDIVKHLLFILGRQNFSPRIMNTERARRLIESLTDIENHVKGRSIVLGRVTIYRKLLKQSRISMLASPGWVENLFTDMTSGAREIRTLAIAFGFEAALQLGTEKQASRAVVDLLRRDVGESQYVNNYAKRLCLMIGNKQDGDLVPQIWSIVVLFLRYRAHQLEDWEFITSWLHVIEKCFNSRYNDTKMQANLAWNRFVFALQLDESTAPTMVKILSKGLELQLRRKLVGRHAKEARQVTVGSLCNLLYYALNPNATSTQLDLYWDEYVVQLIGNTLLIRNYDDSEIEEADLAHACEIMGALLDPSPRAWVNNRANENGPIKAEELPGIDPKWIRRNAQRVFKILEPLIQKCFQNLAKWESSIDFVWSKFASSVAAAGAKEVKVSNDTMSSMACVFTLLYKLWEVGTKDLPGDDDGQCLLFQRAFTLLVTTITSSLGVLPFTEKLLAMGPQESFVIVATPSHHPVKPRGEIKCPLHHLFILLARPAAGISCDDTYLGMVKTILQIFFENRKTRPSRVELVKDLSQLLSFSGSDTRMSLLLWRALASFTILAFNLKMPSCASSNSSGSFDQLLGSEYRNIVKILELGIFLSPNEPLQDWKDLFATTIAQVTLEAGHSGRAISIIEPLSRALVERVSKNEQNLGLVYCTMLISNAIYPGEKQAVDAARRRLWGTSSVGSKPSSFDPYSHFYVYVRQCLEVSYEALAVDGPEAEIELVSVVSDLVQGCPTIHVTGLLTNIQSGLVPWILDQDMKYGDRKSSILANAVTLLWKHICSAIRSLPLTDSGLLNSLESIICAGLESKHKRTVSATISTWNSTFGVEPRLEYPLRVTEAILRLRPIANIQLPSFPDHFEDESTSTRPTFEDESQEEILHYDLGNYNMSRSSTNREQTPPSGAPPLPQLSPPASSRLIEAPSLESRKRSFQGTPENNKRKVARKNITPRLRHDDSQVQFEAIDSSPFADAVLDSQLLTDRQREVKERQRERSAMFANIGINPTFNTWPEPSNVTPNSNLSAAKRSNPNDPSTPDLSLRDKVAYDEYITSSPTPRRGNLRVHLDIDSMEPPSSPPDQSLQDADPKITIPAQFRGEADRSKSDIWDVTSSPPDRSQGLSHSFTDLGPSAQIAPQFGSTEGGNELSVIKDSVEDYQSILRQDRPSTPTETRGTGGLGQQAARTPNEVFVDALSSPASSTPAREIALDGMYTDAASMPLRNSLLQQATVMEDNNSALVSNVEKQHDSQISYPLSEMDEESMLRLIVKFDGPLQNSRTGIGVGDDYEVLEPESSRSSEGDFHTANIEPYNETMSSPSNVKELNSDSSPVIGPQLRGGLPTTVKSSNIERGDKVNLHERDTSRRTRKYSGTHGIVGAISGKRKIIDECTEVRSSQGTKSIGYSIGMPRSERAREATLHIGGDHESITSSVADVGQLLPTEFDVQMPGATNLTSESEFRASHSSDESEKRKPSVVPGRIQNENTVCERGSERWSNCMETSPRVASGREAEVDEAHLVDESRVIGLQVVSKFEEILASLRSAALTRDEAQKVENLLWDVKGELYAAEKRGRETG